MRVRTSADSIRNLERLLAFDEAAGSRGMWPSTERQVSRNPQRLRVPARMRAKVLPRPGARGRVHAQMPRFSPGNVYFRNRPLERSQ